MHLKTIWLSASRPVRLLKTQRLSLLKMEKMAATSTYSDEDPFLNYDELEEDEAVIEDDEHTHQIELASYLLHKIAVNFDFCDNGNSGLRSIL